MARQGCIAAAPSGVAIFHLRQGCNVDVAVLAVNLEAKLPLPRSSRALDSHDFTSIHRASGFRIFVPFLYLQCAVKSLSVSRPFYRMFFLHLMT